MRRAEGKGVGEDEMIAKSFAVGRREDENPGKLIGKTNPYLRARRDVGASEGPRQESTE